MKFKKGDAVLFQRPHEEAVCATVLDVENDRIYIRYSIKILTAIDIHEADELLKPKERDGKFSPDGAFRESAIVEKEDLLTKEFCLIKERHKIPEAIYYAWQAYDDDYWGEETISYITENLTPDGGFNPAHIKAVSDWACTKRQPPYPTHNWILGMPVIEMLRSALRHWKANNEGVKLDPESGLPSLWHFEWNLYIAIVYIATGTGK